MNKIMRDQYIIYKTKPFNGYRMGSKEFLGKKVVGIPMKKLQEARDGYKDLCVVDKTKKELSYMIFKGTEIPEAFGQFEDKYGRGGDDRHYTLCYFVWNPLSISQQSLFKTKHTT